MSDTRVHFLNVRNGDCSILERAGTDRVTMIDVCCGNLGEVELSEARAAFKKTAKPRGNYGMCKKPTNPIDYLSECGISDIWRFILTHPDMDHMDGLKRLFVEKSVLHFWDCGIRREKPDFGNGSPFEQSDWEIYEILLTNKLVGTKVIAPRAGEKRQFWGADDSEGNGGGDYISIVSPDETLISSANGDGNIHDASYVLVYRSSAGRFIFSGDSNDKTWEYVMDNHRDLIENAVVLFAPHHGRDSDRNYTFLDTIKPKITFFGCAPSEHLAYDAWKNRNLLFFTNNQCGNVRVYPNDKQVDTYIENFNYANDYTSSNTHVRDGYWYLCSV